ncbi:hypothetical protein IAQ61_001188 [Plenodomus lingam]|uniref:uncharacterized protein n=1 Tax=Leptosphaeria maculans TaxID=5022 RepID=UPI003325785D|nr:hypothetical protein IAQ61_001188 [Plenodomus lingam]
MRVRHQGHVGFLLQSNQSCVIKCSLSKDFCAVDVDWRVVGGDPSGHVMVGDGVTNGTVLLPRGYSKPHEHAGIKSLVSSHGAKRVGRIVRVCCGWSVEQCLVGLGFRSRYQHTYRSSRGDDPDNFNKLQRSPHPSNPYYYPPIKPCTQATHTSQPPHGPASVPITAPILYITKNHPHQAQSHM